VIGVNMKVLFKHMINGYTGKADDSIIYYNRYLNRVIIRRRPDRKNGEEKLFEWLLKLNEVYFGGIQYHCRKYFFKILKKPLARNRPFSYHVNK